MNHSIWVHIYVSMNFQSCRLVQFGLTDFTKKNTPGPESEQTGASSTGPAQICPTVRGIWRQTALTSGARWSAAPVGRSGTERPGLLDQVPIDGLWPSSSSGCGERLETLAGSRSRRGSPLGLLQRRGWDGVTRRSTTNPGMVNIGELGARMQICATAVAWSTSGVHRGSALTSLGQKKVGLGRYGDEEEICEGRGERGGRGWRHGLLLPWRTLRKKTFPSADREGWSLGWPPRVRERMCGSGMSVQKGAMVLGGFIYRGVVV
jgi:hypothetical protein